MLSGLLSGYRATGETEAADLERMSRLAAAAADPWSRSLLPMHFTASSLVVHPPTGRVLLRWHARQERWLQVGGHGDPGESDPLAIALREGAEETGLTDLVPWPDSSLRHAVICDVRPSATEPAHKHADLRFILATWQPESAVPENEFSPLRWLALDEAQGLAQGNNLSQTLFRLAALLDGTHRCLYRSGSLAGNLSAKLSLGRKADRVIVLSNVRFVVICPHRRHHVNACRSVRESAHRPPEYPIIGVSIAKRDSPASSP